MKHFVAFCLFTLSAFPLFAGNLEFGENKSQWPSQVSFSADLHGGKVFLEKNCFTFSYYSLTDLEHIHDQAEQAKLTADFLAIEQAPVRFHAYKVNFEGASENASVKASGQLPGYYNYILGNDPNAWVSEVHHFNLVSYSDLYPGIGMNVYSVDQSLKYDLLLEPGADPSLIRIRYEGLNSIKLHDGKLELITTVNNLTEEKPYAYQLINGVRKTVRCEYRLNGDVLTYAFPDDYDHSLALVIDPVLIASTYSGSTVTTFGHCATYDELGNIYTGGRCFGQGYPTTVGAFQSAFGGNVDIAISKYDPTGATLNFATYIGGNNDEYAHSMITNANSELYIYGSCASSNYPTTAGCYDNTFNSAGFSYDIIVTRLNATGTGLIGSTYVGGSGSDGNNQMWNNYGDQFRGEIAIDAAGNAYINSFTQSSDFPVTATAYDQTYNGLQDACVFQLDPTMSNLLFSTFLGGTADDGGFGIRLDSNGGLVICGATSSSDFPTTPGSYQTTYQGGQYDGWVARLVLNGSTLLVSSFFGTAQLDETFFVELDASDNIYIYGQADGGAPITAGVFSVPNSPMYVAKFDPTFTSIMFSTQFGGGSFATHISPAAFMVDYCENIYISGFGAQTGWPVSPNALYSTSAVGTCYLLVLNKNAVSVNFGTFYGGWHVDGGTSRFDPNGIVYQAVCQGGSGFPVTAWAYNNGNTAPGWDIVVFKIDFQAQGTQASASAAPNTTGCAPFTVNFTNTSTGVYYSWDYGDGSPIDTTTSPTHIFTNPGTYNVMLIAHDSLACITEDTMYLTITVIPSPIVSLGPDTVLCATGAATFDAGNPGMTYLWSTGATTQQTTVSNAGTYWVTVNNGTCQTTDTINVSVVTPVGFPTDTTICTGDVVQLDAHNQGSSYLWNNGQITQSINTSAAGTYWVEVTQGSCVLRDSIDVFLLPLPLVNLGNDTVLCPGSTLTLDAGNAGSTFLWSSGAVTQTFTPPVNNNLPATHAVEVTDANGCKNTDSIEVSYMALLSLGNDATLCDQPSVTLDATTPGATYQWSTGETGSSIQVQTAGLYWVETTLGTCVQHDTMNVVGTFGGTTLYIPNTFTPNHDGLNDRFTAYGDGIITFDMKIFNRWGELIFQTSDYNNGWDGNFKNILVKNDVYVYVIEFSSICTGGASVRQIGHVLVYR